MNQNLPPNHNSAQKDDEFEVNFDFLDADIESQSPQQPSTPQKSIGDELDDLSFLNSLGDDDHIAVPPPAKDGADDGFDDFLSSLDNDKADEVAPAIKDDVLDEMSPVAAPAGKSSLSKTKEQNAKAKKSLFSFGKKGDDKKANDKKGDDKKVAKAKKPLFSFGKKSDDKGADNKKPTEKPKKASPLGFGKKGDDKGAAATDKSSKAKKPLFSFGKKSDDKGADNKKPTEKPKKASSFAFGKKDASTAKPTADKAGKPATTKAGKPATNKKTLWLALAALLALALLFAAWFMMNSEEEAPAVPPPAPVAPVAPTMPAASEPAPIPAEEANNTQANQPLVTEAETIDTDAIVKAEVPQDPALIKEEIDRLNDKNSQFQEQAKIIDEQLGKLEELTVAKEEKIALLEAQIAQLEAQKKK